MADINTVVAQQFALGESSLARGESAINTALDSGTFSIPGYAWSGLKIGNYDAPKVEEHRLNVDYVAPNYTPALLNVERINAIDPLNLPQSYAINTSGLFLASPPKGTVSTFDIPAPTVDFAKIDTLLANIKVPDIQEFEMPTLSNINIKPVPVINTPAFLPQTKIESIDKPINQQAFFNAEYERLLPELKTWVDDGVNNWVAEMFPNFPALRDKVQSKLSSVIDGKGMLHDDYLLKQRTQTRDVTEREFNAQVKNIHDARKRAGFKSLPQTVSSSIDAVNLAKANALAKQQNDLEIRLIEIENETVKWAVNAALSQHQTLIGAFMQYAGVMAQINEQSISKSNFYVGLYGQWYEQCLNRLRLILDTLRTEAAIYETELKAAMAVLETYRLELDANKLVIEVDAQRLDFVTKQIQLQMTKVQIYSALLDSVNSRAKLEQSKVQLFGEQVNAYNSQLQGDKLRNDIYLAGLQGDEAKLKAEMAKLEAWEKTADVTIKAKQAEIAVQGNSIDKAKLAIEKYKADWDGIKAELTASGMKFEYEYKAQSAAIEVYLNNLKAKLDVLGFKYERDKLLLNQDEFNAEQQTKGMQVQSEFMNNHYQFIANLTKDIGNMYMNFGSAAVNAQITAFTQAA